MIILSLIMLMLGTFIGCGMTYLYMVNQSPTAKRKVGNWGLISADSDLMVLNLPGRILNFRKDDLLINPIVDIKLEYVSLYFDEIIITRKSGVMRWSVSFGDYGLSKRSFSKLLPDIIAAINAETNQKNKT